jgi:hypothetical protein
MKKNLTKENTKDVIKGFRLSRESLYYAILFGVAFAVSLVLLFIAIKQENKGLIIYSSILIPIFLISASVATRFTVLSKNKIYVDNGILVIKTFFATKKFKTADIKKLTSAQHEKNITAIKITYQNRVHKFNFKNFTKEDLTHMKRAIKNI